MAGVKYRLPDDVRVQCPECGTPTTTVEPKSPGYDGTVELNCGCVLPPGRLTEAWRA